MKFNNGSGENVYRIKKLLAASAVAVVTMCIVGGAAIYYKNPVNRMKMELNQAADAKAVEIYNKEIAGTSYEAEGKTVLLNCMEGIVSASSKEEMNYTKAASRLYALKQLKNDEMSVAASEKSKFVIIEGEGKQFHKEAESYFSSREYAKAMRSVKKMNTEYSQYEAAAKLYGQCKNLILDKVKNPLTVDEYEKGIALLESALESVDEREFTERKQQLEEEVVVAKDVVQITRNAADYYNNESYKEAFATLNNGLKKYPDNEKITGYLDEYHTSYIENIRQQTAEACEGKDYKKALKIVKTAIQAHDCEEFEELLRQVRKEKSFLYWAIDEIFT